jgi:spore maturation protein CgeB
MFGDGIVIADSPRDFAEKIEHYRNASACEREAIAKVGQQYVKKNHTGFHRAAQILEEFGLGQLSDKLLQQYRESLYAEN